jgi:PadR family transcriptional regulator AphA
MLNRKPRSGYEIKAFADRSTRFFWAASYGQIYPELRRLEEAGLIEGKSEPTGGRRRTVYRITSNGKRALRDWLVSPGGTHELRDEELLKLFFADTVSDEQTLRIVREKRARHMEVLERLRAVESAGRARPGRSSYLVLEYGIALNKFIAEWFAEAERRLVADNGTERSGRVSASR